MGATYGRAPARTLAVAAFLVIAVVPSGGANHIPPDVTCPGEGEQNTWDFVFMGGTPEFFVFGQDGLFGKVPPSCFVHPGCTVQPQPCIFEVEVTVTGNGFVQGFMNPSDDDAGPTEGCMALYECTIRKSIVRANDLQVVCGADVLTNAADFTLFCRNRVVGIA